MNFVYLSMILFMFGLVGSYLSLSEYEIVSVIGIAILGASFVVFIILFTLYVIFCRNRRDYE